MKTYPWTNSRQCAVVHYVIGVIWDVGFSNADYNEVEFRLLDSETQLFPDKETVTETISELCEKGVLISRMTTYSFYNQDGSLRSVSGEKAVLGLTDKFRTEAMNLMTEILDSTVSRYFSPKKK